MPELEDCAFLPIAAKWMRKDIFGRRTEIEEWISQKQSKADICRKLRCRPATLDGYLEKFGLVYSGNMGGKGIKISPFRKTASEFLFYGIAITSHKLKLRLINENIKQKICERCKNEEWMGEKIPLELHHINGNRFDNTLANLQLLCPNCHALTDNYSGRKTRKD